MGHSISVLHAWMLSGLLAGHIDPSAAWPSVHVHWLRRLRSGTSPSSFGSEHVAEHVWKGSGTHSRYLVCGCG